MRVLLVNIPLRPEMSKKLFPIGLGYIATALKLSEIEFDLLDLDANRKPNGFLEEYFNTHCYDVVCVGLLVSGYKIIKSLSKLIKKSNPCCKIIVGNSAATSIPEILLNNTCADIAVLSEGDQTIINLLNALSTNESLENVNGICFKKDGNIVKTKPQPLISDVSSLPFIDYGVFDINEYIKSSPLNINDIPGIDKKIIKALPINTARGCVANCSFCYHVFKGQRYRYRSPVSIIGEIKGLIDKYGINYVNFWDEITFFSKTQANNLVQHILDEGLKFYWIARCRANLFSLTEDLKIIEKMKKAGCCGVQYSLESSDPVILKEMNKNITPEQFSVQTELFQKVGITTWTSLVFGYPQETEKTIKNTVDCCIKNKIYPSAGFLLPQPGSKMYDYAINNGFIKDEEEYILKMGDRQDLLINMTQLSDEKLINTVNQELQRCNNELNVGLKEENLIKSKRWVNVETKNKHDI